MIRQLREIIDFIYPPKCHVCDTKLALNDKFICRKCRSELPRTGFHREDLNPMAERFAGLFPFLQATGLFFYSSGSPLSQLIQDMKYRSFPGIATLFGEMAVEELYSTGFFNEMDYVTAVPMHWYKKAVRGFNQSEIIAQAIAAKSGLKYINLLKMTRPHRTQANLDRNKRLLNAENLFKIRKNILLKEKGVLLVDDVCTTGTTLRAAAQTLFNNYPDFKLKLLTIGVTF